MHELKKHGSQEVSYVKKFESHRVYSNVLPHLWDGSLNFKNLNEMEIEQSSFQLVLMVIIWLVLPEFKYTLSSIKSL